MQLNEIHDNHEHASTSLKVILLVFALVLVGTLGYLVWQQNNETPNSDYQLGINQSSNAEKKSNEIYLDNRFMELTAQQKQELGSVAIASDWKKVSVKEGSFSLTFPNNLAKLVFMDQAHYENNLDPGDHISSGIGFSGENFGDALTGIDIMNSSLEDQTKKYARANSYLHSYTEKVNGIKMTVVVTIDSYVKLPNYRIEKYYLFDINNKTVRIGPITESTVIYDTPGSSSESLTAEALEFKSLKYHKMIDLAVHTIEETK